jgi:energy-coupling factor transport system ATP-binding protein
MKNKKKYNLKPTTSAIIAEDLSFKYDKASSTNVIDKFHYNFERGKIYCIIGDSGSGKSTLIQQFNGLLRSQSGTVQVDDILVYPELKKIKRIKDLRRKVGLVFQFPEYQLFKKTILEDISFGPLALYNKKTIKIPKKLYKKEVETKAEKYLNKMGLSSEFLSYSPFEISGGQKRRVAIAGILCIENDTVIFDEPTAGLDPVGEQEMMKTILDLKSQNKTVIVVTHNMEHVLEIADRVIVLNKGKILSDGSAFDIFMDKKIINNTSITTPMLISFINKLVEKDPSFLYLLENKPRTVQELVCLIKQRKEVV